MESERIMRVARQVNAWGLGSLAAALLTSLEPVAFLGAQTLYMFSPLLEPFAPQQSVTDWAQILEDPVALNDLTTHLMETA